MKNLGFLSTVFPTWIELASAPSHGTTNVARPQPTVAAQTHRLSEFRARLREHTNGQLKDVALRALALGWSEKWRTN
jgi:hypothetical protein